MSVSAVRARCTHCGRFCDPETEWDFERWCCKGCPTFAARLKEMQDACSHRSAAFQYDAVRCVDCAKVICTDKSGGDK